MTNGLLGAALGISICFTTLKSEQNPKFKLGKTPFSIGTEHHFLLTNGAFNLLFAH